MGPADGTRRGGDKKNATVMHGEGVFSPKLCVNTLYIVSHTPIACKESNKMCHSNQRTYKEAI